MCRCFSSFGLQCKAGAVCTGQGRGTRGRRGAPVGAVGERMHMPARCRGPCREPAGCAPCRLMRARPPPPCLTLPCALRLKKAEVERMADAEKAEKRERKEKKWVGRRRGAGGQGGAGGRVWRGAVKQGGKGAGLGGGAGGTGCHSSLSATESAG